MQSCWGCNGTGRQGTSSSSCGVCFHHPTGKLPNDGRVRCWGCNGSGMQGSSSCGVCFHHPTGCLPAAFVRDHTPCWGCKGSGMQGSSSCGVCFHHPKGCLPNDGRVRCWGCNGSGMQGSSSCGVCFHHPTGCLPAAFVRDHIPCWGCNGSGMQGSSSCGVCFHHPKGCLPKSISSTHIPCPDCRGTGQSRGGVASCSRCFSTPTGCIPLTDINGQRTTVDRRGHDRRESRLNSNIRTLYHQTSSESAAAILSSGQMLRGSLGLAGGGIYFALTKEATNFKALHHGVVLSCRVRLGNVKTIESRGDSSVTFRGLLAEGYDSVCVPRSAGHEYVVYNSDQVTSISRA
jgi:hypothetical protein